MYIFRNLIQSIQTLENCAHIFGLSCPTYAMISSLSIKTDSQSVLDFLRESKLLGYEILNKIGN